MSRNSFAYFMLSPLLLPFTSNSSHRLWGLLCWGLVFILTGFLGPHAFNLIALRSCMQLSLLLLACHIIPVLNISRKILSNSKLPFAQTNLWSESPGHNWLWAAHSVCMGALEFLSQAFQGRMVYSVSRAGAGWPGLWLLWTPGLVMFWRQLDLLRDLPIFLSTVCRPRIYLFHRSHMHNFPTFSFLTNKNSQWLL